MRLVTCLLSGWLMLLPAAGMAEEAAAPSHRIVAVVNEALISSLDVEARMRLALVTTGLQDSPEIRTKLFPQVLRALVDETLQVQEAGRQGITVTDAEVDQGIASIEQQRGRPPGSLKEYLAGQKVPISTLQQQLRAQIAWSKLVAQKIRPRVRVSQDEVARKQNEPVTRRQQEVQVLSLLLPVDTTEQEKSMQELAAKLESELKGGASFEAIAGQFSGTESVARASEPVWVELGSLDPAIAAQLRAMQDGGITSPVRTPEGYQIVKLLQSRNSTVIDDAPDAEVALKQVVLSLKQDAAEKEAALSVDIAKEVAKHPGTCEEKGIAGLGNPDDMSVEVSFIRQRLSALSENVRTMLSTTGVGEVTEPFATPQGIQFFLLCERTELPPQQGDADRTRNKIYQQKLALEASKYMRTLRRDAFIEIRG